MSAGAPPPDGPPPIPPEDAPTVYQPYPEPVEEVPLAPTDAPPVPVDVPPGPPLDPAGLPPEEPEPSRELWPWLLLLLVLVIGGLLAAYLLTRNGNDNNHNAGTTAPNNGTTVPVQTTPGTVSTKNIVPVPSVVGLKQAEAEAHLKSAGLKSQTRTQPGGRAAGTVIAQNPAAGVKVKPGALVGLTVSGGPQKKGVPDVVGLTAAEATSKLTAAGLKTTTTQVFSTKQSGNVISQTPAAGTNVAKGSTVQLTVSKGPKDVSVPKVVGLSRSAAETKLRNAGLVPSPHGVPSNKKAGNVVAQNPAAGGTAPEGSKVRINISNGPSGSTSPTPTGTTPTGTTPTGTTSTTPSKIVVPDVTGEDEQQATNDLENAGFVVNSTDRTVTDQTQDGIVQDERPAGGSQAPSGSTVTIVVGRFSG